MHWRLFYKDLNRTFIAHTMKHAIAFALVAVAVLASACRQPDSMAATPTRLPTRLAALMAGKLTLSDGCIRVGDYALAFPPEFDVKIDGDAVTVGDGLTGEQITWQNGGLVEVGGGIVSRQGMTEPVRTRLSASCREPFWLVGGIGIHPNTRVPKTAARLRIHNSGAKPLKGLTVIFPDERIQYGDVPAGATTEDKEFARGVFGYAAYSFDLDGRSFTQPVVDWVGEKPLVGKAFTYDIDYDASRMNLNTIVRLNKVITDVK